MENLAFIAAALLILLVIYAVYSRTRGAAAVGSVLLMGDCEAGKTSVLYALLYGTEEERLTVTSMAENRETLTVGGKSVPVVDIPGHARIRPSALGRHSAGCRAVCVLVDSATLAERLRDVAGILYTALTEPALARRPLAVACHKADLEGAWDPRRVQEALQQEIELLRTTSANRLSSHSPALPLPPSAPFSFPALPRPVTFLASSTVQSGGLQALEDWLATVA